MKTTLALLCLFAVLVASGCDRSDVSVLALTPTPAPLATATPTLLAPRPTTTPTPFLDSSPQYRERLEEAEQRWRSQNIDDYQMNVTTYALFDFGVTVQHEVTVRNGQIVQQECVSEDCLPVPDFLKYTIPGIFEEARMAVRAENPLARCATILFYRKYHFPHNVLVACPDFDIQDEEYSIRISAFKVLE